MLRFPSASYPVFVRISRALPFALGISLLLMSGCATQKTPAPPVTARAIAPPDGVVLTPRAGRVVVTVDGQPFTEYRFADTPRPILYPVIGPGGDAMTRHFPMTNPPGEEHDHPHHRSIWFGHGLVNGEDFWTERESSGRIVHRGFTQSENGPDHATLQSYNDWVSAAGRVLCADERTMTFYRGSTNARWIDFTITLRATNGELILGDTREGTMGVRVAESMRVTHGTGGRIVNSEGQMDLEAWGRRAKWCSYSGPLGDRIVGITLMDYPANPRHATWWMVRDYGLLAANPFGQHEFERLADSTAGEMRIPSGESVTFRYRIVLHEGDAETARVEELYAEFAAPGEGR